MSADHPSPVDGESEAHRLVGAFLQSFALVEQALDAGIGKLLSLERGKNAIICSSIPFAKKLGVFFSAEGLLAAIPSKEREKKLRKTRAAIHDLNQKRIMFVHSTFLYHVSGGVSFRRVVADGKLKVDIVNLNKEDIEVLCEEAGRLVSEIDSLVSEMKPYVPSLDFSDPRNSGYLSLFFDDI